MGRHSRAEDPAPSRPDGPPARAGRAGQPHQGHPRVRQVPPGQARANPARPQGQFRGGRPSRPAARPDQAPPAERHGDRRRATKIDVTGPIDPAAVARAKNSSDTGTHRIVGKKQRRRVAKWPIACLVLVALAVLGWLGWGWANGIVNNRAEAQASACTGGDTAIAVVVAPDAERPAKAAADRWNQASTVVHGHCVRVDVRAASSERTLNALAGRGSLDEIGGLPAAWMPDSSSWVTQLKTAKPGMISSPPEPIAVGKPADYPYVGIGGKIDDVQQRAAQSFREFLKQPTQQTDFADAGLSKR
ncbi:hypothetical protein GCM10009754_62120 [Amycolatopsis minnesotensis]|uniref:Extracellular solute-binding protein n=1 Tax=Amycolatopsis minnesotensis TaxID=337894 RepID=A0ABN2RZT5_9PSEU